jgi:hypothetical protein
MGYRRKETILGSLPHKPFPKTAWMIIHGIEDGWFRRTRSGYLALTDKAIKARGLDREQDNGMEI